MSADTTQRAGRRSIYVVDDDSMIRRSLSFTLSAANFEVRPFISGSDFIDEMPFLFPGAVLLDLSMPGMDGIAVLNLLQEKRAEFPAIVMTGHGDVITAVLAMKAGARDFIEKPIGDAVLMNTLEDAFHAIDAPADNPSVTPLAEARLRTLTPRELDVLRGLVSGFPNKIIAHRLSLSTRTIEMHRASMMSRLGLRNLSELLRIAFAAKVAPL